MGLGILLVYIGLVILFDSFVTPVTILLSLPLCVGGAILALYLFNMAISLPVVIGGLLISTLLSLLFVPSLFSVITNLKLKLRRGLVAFLQNKPLQSDG